LAYVERKMKASLVVGICWAMYLGTMLGVLLDVHYYDWEWWAIVLPVIVLSGIEKEMRRYE